MRPSRLAFRLKDLFLRTDDGSLMRYAFFGLLLASGAFVFIDMRELTLANASLPGHDPLRTEAPVLPPAPTGPGRR